MDGIKGELLQYKGGGYSGCIWEWNYSAVVTEGECAGYYVIYASGRYGCTTAEQWEVFEQNARERDLYRYTLTEAGLASFVEESNAGHVKGVGDWLYNEFGIEVMATCEDCGREFPTTDMLAGGLEGCGGIAVQFSELFCENCYLTPNEGQLDEARWDAAQDMRKSLAARFPEAVDELDELEDEQLGDVFEQLLRRAGGYWEIEGKRYTYPSMDVVTVLRDVTAADVLHMAR